MDIKELQKLAEKVGGIVVMENDSPAFVILNYSKFSELTGYGTAAPHEILDEDFQDSFTGEMLKSSSSLVEDEAVEELNKEILTLAEEIENKEKSL